MNSIVTDYPGDFRQKDCDVFHNRLEHRQSVELVGMKRVGINNFLRFYLEQYGRQMDETMLYIPVDLNDLIEREMFPFWRLLFKRIVDAVELSDVADEHKKRISHFFLDAIQSGDLFMTYDGIRSSLVLLAESQKNCTIIFTRFDRLKDAVTPEFFYNLQGLHAATGKTLSYVFTSFRELEKLAPTVFPKNLLFGFTHKMYIKPTDFPDTQKIISVLSKQYSLSLDEKITQEVVTLSGGHVQYLRILLLILHEIGIAGEYHSAFTQDERVILQSEELWESLDHAEQEVLKKILRKEKISKEEKYAARYLWDTGFVNQENILFSSLFQKYVEGFLAAQEDMSDVEFSKKEFLLFSILKDNLGNITDREKIIETVWSEYQDFGVSDWSLDRLVARVRNKLKKQKSSMEIITVRTRGYKLVEN